VAVDGWSKVTGHDVIDLARKFEGYGVEAIVYTDIGRDGMLSGVNIEATVNLAGRLPFRLSPAAASPIWTMLKGLCAWNPRVSMGAITGRAIYEGTLTSPRRRSWRMNWAERPDGFGQAHQSPVST